MKIANHFFFIFCACLYATGMTGKTFALTVDIDSNEVGMNLTYTGENLTVFGTVEDGENIAVVVLGPRQDIMLYEKVNSFGIWTNKIIGTFANVPSYYYLSANNRFLLLEDVPQGQVLIKEEVRIEHIRMLGQNTSNEKQKILETMQKKRLYLENHNGVRLVDKNLFRATIPIPKNAPAGIYTLKVITFGQDNYVSEKRALPIFVHKVGTIALISHYAKTNATLYGLAVICISLVVGVLMVLLLRRLRA